MGGSSSRSTPAGSRYRIGTVKFTRTTEYALRVLAFMSRTPREPRSSSDLHRDLGIPKKYLQRLLTALAKHGLIRSIRGRSGGYVVAKSLRKIPLADIVEAVEGFERQPQCFFGFSTCKLDEPCAMHARWVAAPAGGDPDPHQDQPRRHRLHRADGEPGPRPPLVNRPRFA